MSTPLAAFGPGILIVSRTDSTVPSPVNIGYSQEFSIDFAGTSKQLLGQFQFPLAVARGAIKATGKIKAATLSGLAWNAIFFGYAGGASGLSTTSGQIQWNVASTFTSNSTGGTGALQVGSSLTFDADLGVVYASSNLPFRRVSTGNEVIGSYSVTAASPGLYNFADQGANIKVTYTNTTTTGQALVYQNQLIGATPTFQLDYYTNFNQPTSKPFVVRIYSCVASKLMLAAKLEDFILPEFDFDFFANASGNVFDMTFPEIS